MYGNKKVTTTNYNILKKELKNVPMTMPYIAMIILSHFFSFNKLDTNTKLKISQFFEIMY